MTTKRFKKGELVMISELSTLNKVSPVLPRVGKIAASEKETKEHLLNFDVFTNDGKFQTFTLLEMPDAVINKYNFLHLKEIRALLDKLKEKDLGLEFFILERRIVLPVKREDLLKVDEISHYPMTAKMIRERLSKEWQHIKKYGDVRMYKSF